MFSIDILNATEIELVGGVWAFFFSFSLKNLFMAYYLI